MPLPLLVFIQNLCKEGAYIPDNFMTPYELNRIDVNNYGAIISLDDNQLNMIASIYLYSKLLISKVLLNPTGQQDTELDPQIAENFKILASVLYYIFMQVSHGKMLKYARQKDTPNNDIISKKLYQYAEIKPFFTDGQDQKQFIEEMKKQMELWIRKLGLFVKNSERINEKRDIKKVDDEK